MFGPRKLWQRTFAGVACLGMISQVGLADYYPVHRGQVRRVQYCPPGCQPHYPYSAPSQHGEMTVPSETSPQNSMPSNTPGSSGTAPPMPSAPAPMNTPFPDQNFNNAPQPNFNPAPQNNAIASTDTGGFGSQAPNMIGDYFGTFGNIYSPLGGGLFPGVSPFITGNLGAAPGANVGRVKLGENVS
ncbi:MAG: hypothetical protein ACK50J_14125, partial [Planctomyces sp.]